VWEPFDTGGTIGQEGSENGTIIRDEEHLRSARITLERDTPTASFAITCGVYDWMVHTRFFAIEADALAQFDAMKGALTEITATIPRTDDPELDAKMGDVSTALTLFIQQYP
jgi:hypothetical protein